MIKSVCQFKHPFDFDISVLRHCVYGKNNGIQTTPCQKKIGDHIHMNACSSFPFYCCWDTYDYQENENYSRYGGDIELERTFDFLLSIGYPTLLRQKLFSFINILPQVLLSLIFGYLNNGSTIYRPFFKPSNLNVWSIYREQNETRQRKLADTKAISRSPRRNELSRLLE